MFLPGCFSITIHRVAKSRTWLSDWTELNWTELPGCCTLTSTRQVWILPYGTYSLLRKWKSLSCGRIFSTPWTVVHRFRQARILEWVALPFSRGSSQPRNWTGASCIVGGFFTNRAIREAHSLSVQFSSVQSLSHVRFFATPWTSALQASLSITNSPSPPKPMSIELVMPSNHLILHCPLLLLPSIFPSIRVFSNESALLIRWPKYWSFRFNIRPSKEHPGLISFRVDWLDLLAVQGTLKSLLQHHSSKTSILLYSAFFTVQLSYPYMTTGKTIALTRRAFVGKVVSAF